MYQFCSSERLQVSSHNENRSWTANEKTTESRSTSHVLAKCTSGLLRVSSTGRNMNKSISPSEVHPNTLSLFRLSGRCGDPLEVTSSNKCLKLLKPLRSRDASQASTCCFSQDAFSRDTAQTATKSHSTSASIPQFLARQDFSPGRWIKVPSTHPGCAARLFSRSWRPKSGRCCWGWSSSAPPTKLGGPAAPPDGGAETWKEQSRSGSNFEQVPVVFHFAILQKEAKET